MRFNLLSLLFVVTLIAMSLALYRANTGWSSSQQKLSALRLGLGMADEPDSFSLVDVAGADSPEATAWRIRVENFKAYQLEFRVHGRHSFNSDLPLAGIDTFVSHNYSSESSSRHFSNHNGSSVFGRSFLSFSADEGHRVAAVRNLGKNDGLPFVYLLTGKQELLERFHLEVWKLEPRTSERLHAFCVEKGITCTTLRLRPFDEDPKKNQRGSAFVHSLFLRQETTRLQPGFQLMMPFRNRVVRLSNPVAMSAFGIAVKLCRDAVLF